MPRGGSAPARHTGPPASSSRGLCRSVTSRDPSTFLPAASRSSPWLSPLTSGQRRNDVHDVSVAQRRVFPSKEPSVLVVHEEREVCPQSAVFVAQPLFERRVRVCQRLEGVAQRG